MSQVITLDGPAGAGKSTVAKALASRLGYRYLDTGAMYRAITWKALDQGVSLEDDASLTALAEASRLELRPDPAEMRVILDGYDVSAAIREPRISQAVSYVARVPGVRRAMVDLQRQIGQGGALVAEGRDMAMVVFPDAALKIYLDASPRERARRRASDLAAAGHPADILALEQEIAKRDHLDSTRADSPLTRSGAHTAVVTDDLTVDEVVDKIIDLL
jgi:cytidylate kinase